MAEGRGERATGTPNTIYGLSSVLFHALEGGASYDAYVEDAEREGDEELTEFFRRVREEDRDRASEARLLIAERTPTAARAEGAAAARSPGPESPTAPPDTEPTGEEAATARREEVSPSDVQRGTSSEALPRTEESPREQERRIEREREAEGLIDRARGYLLGEGRERDYLGGEDRERK